MPQVDTWDYVNRRFYLSFDTVTNGIDFAAAYLEERAYRAVSGAQVRGMKPMMSGQGFVPKGGGRFTERYVLLLDNARPVPYDASHRLRILVEPITDTGLSGADVFDRSALSPGTEIDIDVGYSQVEVITVSASGSNGGLTPAQDQRLTTIETVVNAIATVVNAILALFRADEIPGQDRYQRVDPATQNVLLDKDVERDGTGRVTRLREHQ